MIYDDPRSLEGELEAAARYEQVESLADEAASLSPLADAVNEPGWLDIVAYLLEMEQRTLDHLTRSSDFTKIARDQGALTVIRDLIALPERLSERLRSLHEQMEEK